MIDFIKSIDTDTSFLFIVIRSVFVYIFGIFLFRVGNTRFKFNLPFDLVLVFIIAAIYGKAIFDGPLFQFMLITILLIILHKIFAKLTIKYSFVDFIIKGSPKLLLNNGKIDWNEMKKNGISKADLQEHCRRQFQTENLEGMEKIILERSGEITYIRK